MSQQPYGAWQRPDVKPGVVPLRPLGLGEILDGAVSTMRAHPKPMLGVAAVVVTITQIVSTIVLWLVFRAVGDPTRIDPENPGEELGPLLASLFGGFGVTVVISLLAQAFLVGFVTVVVGRAVLGRPLDFAEVWQELRPRLLPLLGLTVVYTLMVVIGLLACVLPGIWLAVVFGLAAPALVFERCGVGQAFTRSRALVKGSWWRVFGILLLSTAITFLIGLILGLPFGFAGAAVDGGLESTDAPSLARLSLEGVGAIVSGIIAYPFSAGVGALLYLDQRMRREGLDIELARAAGIAVPDPTYGHPGQVPGYGQPPAGFTSGHAPGFAQPPAGYEQPPGYAQPPGYPPPPGYAQPPAGYDARPPAGYGPPPAYQQSPSEYARPAEQPQPPGSDTQTPAYGQPPITPPTRPAEPAPGGSGQPDPTPAGAQDASPPAVPGQDEERKPEDRPPGQAG
jgi:hypothetical protein